MANENTPATPDTDTAVSLEDTLIMQAQAKFQKSLKPRIKSTEVLSVIVAFVNSGAKSKLLDAKYADKEQAFVKQIKASEKLLGRVYPLTNENGLHLVNISQNAAG